jgi:tripartite-type tricarboxylate transporter receptor subunit TctC
MKRFVLSLLAMALSAAPAFAQFPDRSPRIVVGQAAGGSSDVIARMVADAISGMISDSASSSRTGRG